MRAEERIVVGEKVFKKYYRVNVYFRMREDLYDINKRVLFDVYDPDLPIELRTLDLLQPVYSLVPEGLDELLLLFRETAFFEHGYQHPAPPSEWHKSTTRP